MSKVDCSSCDDLRKISTSFINNGVTTTICNSLKNDTGLNPNLTVLHTDCEDLDTVNDCLVGVMDSDLEKYDACDWIKFMHRFIPNLHTTFKTIICAICGLWTNIHSILSRLNSIDDAITALTRRVKKNEDDISALQSRVTTIGNTVANHTTAITNIWKRIGEIEDQSGRIDCIVDSMYKGATFNIGENVDGDAYCVAGKGVSFLARGSGDEHASDIRMLYIAGGLMIVSGSYLFYKEDFTDSKAVGNFDNGSSYRVSASRKGNDYWGTSSVDEAFISGGELICELRIKRSAYPQIRTIYAGIGQESGGGSYSIKTAAFYAGEWAYGQHGMCHENDGSPQAEGHSAGHQVPDGWIYVQIRMSSCVRMSANGTQYSPLIYMGIRMNQDKITC